MQNQTPLHDDYDSNLSGNQEFHQLFNQKINRRDLIKKTAGGAVALTLATSISTHAKSITQITSLVDEKIVQNL